MNREKCPHGRSNTSCFDCGGKRACIHNREKFNCIDCNGKGICEHKFVRKETTHNGWIQPYKFNYNSFGLFEKNRLLRILKMIA